ncbi:hypothetical protein SATRM34S_07027 [Streptomyces atroolivaceus]
MIARIVATVEEASETKVPTQLFIEKVEQRYSLGMVLATLAVFLIPLAFGAVAADTVSIAVMEFVDNGIIALTPGAMDAHLSDALFWTALLGGRRGYRDHDAGQQVDDRPGQGPRRRPHDCAKATEVVPAWVGRTAISSW